MKKIYLANFTGCIRYCFGTETGLLLETMLAGPLDSNLLVTACYLLTLMVFLLSGYRTWLMWRQ